MGKQRKHTDRTDDEPLDEEEESLEEEPEEELEHPFFEDEPKPTEPGREDVERGNDGRTEGEIVPSRDPGRAR